MLSFQLIFSCVIGFFNVADTLEFSSILIYFVQVQSIYTQSSGGKPAKLKSIIIKEGIKKGRFTNEIKGF